MSLTFSELKKLNYSPIEKKLIVKLVAERKHIIENKTCTTETNHLKEVTWNQISSIVSAKCGTHRTGQSVKAFYKNLKRKYRKMHNLSVTEDKTDIFEKIAEGELEQTDQTNDKGLTKLYDWDSAPVMLKELISSAVKTNSGDTACTKKPMVLFIEHTKALQPMQDSISTSNHSVSIPEVDESYDLLSLSNASETIENREDDDVDTKLFCVDGSVNTASVSVRDVAVATEFESVEERRRDELHTLSVREKEIRIQILELEMLRKKFELERDFPKRKK